MSDEIIKIMDPLYKMQREIENRKEERKNSLNNQQEKIETLKNNRLTIKSNLETQLNASKVNRDNRISSIENNRENEINEYFEQYYNQDSSRSISAVRNDLNKEFDDRIRGIEAEYTNQSENLINQIAQLEEESEEERQEKEKLELLERQSDYSVVDVKEMREVKDQVRKELIARQKELSIKLNGEKLNHEIIMQEMSEFKPEYDSEHQMLDTSREAYQNFWKRSNESIDRINEINNELAQIEAGLEMTKYTEEEIIKGMYGLAPHEKDEYLRRKKEREINKMPIIEEEFDVNNDAIDLNKDVDSLSSQFILPPPIITQKNINEEEITPTENETMVDNLDEDIIVVDDPKKDLMVADDPDEDIIVVDDLEEKEPEKKAEDEQKEVAPQGVKFKEVAIPKWDTKAKILSAAGGLILTPAGSLLTFYIAKTICKGKYKVYKKSNPGHIKSINTDESKLIEKYNKDLENEIDELLSKPHNNYKLEIKSKKYENEINLLEARINLREAMKTRNKFEKFNHSLKLNALKNQLNTAKNRYEYIQKRINDYNKETKLTKLIKAINNYNSEKLKKLNKEIIKNQSEIDKKEKEKYTPSTIKRLKAYQTKTINKRNKLGSNLKLKRYDTLINAFSTAKDFTVATWQTLFDNDKEAEKSR